jgi:hypothetical protein
VRLPPLDDSLLGCARGVAVMLSLSR